jgi:DNA polymerase-3 subunit delta'
MRLPVPPWLAACSESLEKAVAGQRTPQALLLHGPEGAGRRWLAGAFAARLLGTQPADGDGAEMLAIAHPDYLLITPEDDSRQIRITQVQQLISFTALTSHDGGAKVAVIWPADQLNVAAANALLKTLEEPAGPTTIMLIAAQRGRLPATIISRCRQLRVPLPTRDQALRWLAAIDPDTDWTDPLELAGGAPFRALELSAADSGPLPARLLENVNQLLRREESPVALAQRWSREDPDLCLRWLYRQVAGLIRQLSVPGGGGSHTGASRLQISEGRINMAACFAYLDELQRARRLLERSLNTELQVADLLAWWYGGAGFSRQ